MHTGQCVNAIQVHAGHPATAAAMMGGNSGRYCATDVTMGYHAPT
jgi:hypothetical protein